MKSIGAMFLTLLLAVAGTAIAAGTTTAEHAIDARQYAVAFAQLEPLVRQGNAEAENDLVTMYLHDLSVPQDYSQAVTWFRKAVAQSNANAQSDLANMYLHGQGVSQNYDRAVDLFRLAAAQGNSPATFNLGQIYLQGQGVSRDRVLGYALIELDTVIDRSNTQNETDDLREMQGRASQFPADQIADADALARQMQQQGVLQAINAYEIAGAREMIRGALPALNALASSSNAQPSTAGSTTPHWVPKMLTDASAVLNTMASSSSMQPASASSMSSSSTSGLQATEHALNSGDSATAVAQFRPLADLGNAEAQTPLQRGMVAVSKGDAEKAVVLLTPLAKAGNGVALDFLGTAYFALGAVSRQQQAQAAVWYRTLAEQGVGAGEAWLGAMYENGVNDPGFTVQKNDAEALRLYRKAAGQQDIMGLTFLAQRYAKGEGVKVDPVAVLALVDVAATNIASVLGHPGTADKVRQSMMTQYIIDQPPDFEAKGMALAKQMREQGVLQALDTRETEAGN